MTAIPPTLPEVEPPTGLVATADPETGEPEAMPFWLLPGVNADALGLVNVLVDDVGGGP